ncbi:nucleoside deaminase [Rhodovibrio salinarum]|uniref:Nucleoside deaminase n=1 Tax=Rhodovibrio salinarum TaxID=1087 RepID=A0A934UYW4_9PROT|nr:nucleoside deaminase [Rhodovibrio salinarum]MBK1695846.1 nucleoside deaminase [Rhodovibrio salinarum]
MARIEPTADDRRFMQEAIAEAHAGYDEGGVPVGAVLVRDGQVLARGRNRLQQEGNPILHGETDCLRQFGRGGEFAGTTLYTTLSPCAMCAGAIILFGIPRVIVGENRNFAGEMDWLLDRGVEVGLLDDPDLADFFARFVAERPHQWGEDIKGYEQGESV